MMLFLLILVAYISVGLLYAFISEPTPDSKYIRFFLALLWPFDVLFVICLIIINWYQKLKNIWNR